MVIWILTSEFNDYDQHGEYFIEAFLTKPSREKLIEAFRKENYYVSDTDISHLLSVGGRRGTEYCWFYLREREIGSYD